MLCKISIVIPSKDKLERLKLVINSLEQQHDENFEVIVVLDGCKADVIESYQFLIWSDCIKTVQLNTNVGRARARNIGIQHASGDVIIFLDDDMVVAPNFIETHRKYHIKGDEVVIGQMLDIKVDENLIASIFSQEDKTSPYYSLYRYQQVNVGALGNKLFPILKVVNLHWSRLYSCNVSISKKQLDRIGVFSTDFSGWGWEDTELGYRCVKKGLNLINCKDVLGLHLHHGHNINNKSRDLKSNYRTFLNIVKGDRVASSYAWILDKAQRFIL